MRSRRYPVGAEADAGGVSFRVWAPDHSRVTVAIEGRGSTELEQPNDGYFEAVVEGACAGDRYRFSLDGEGALYPDPASRHQPDGPHGASVVTDPSAFVWNDAGWQGIAPENRVIYELHVGTFTEEGTYAAAARELARLADLGITLIELMPLAEFPGEFGWGYDGVDLWAPYHLYGSPDDLRRFVDAAHARGIGVMLDVVYNHLGPDGCYLGAFARDYFTRANPTDWGEAIGFDGPRARGVREFFVENAAYWIDEFHMDGLRFDATDAIHDASSPHVLSDMTRRAREAAAGRTLCLIAENEAHDARLTRSVDEGGQGMDAYWNDDLHHSAFAALTGRVEAFYPDHRGRPEELLEAVSGSVAYLETHDQVANTVGGARLHQLTDPGRYRAITALLLLGQATPMLFQGQEHASTRPFVFFADLPPALEESVRKGRLAYLARFSLQRVAAARSAFQDPARRATFEACKLCPLERAENTFAIDLHKDLLALRAHHRADAVQATVLDNGALTLRFSGASGERLLVVNLGPAFELTPRDLKRTVVWSSNDPRYGGPSLVDQEARAPEGRAGIAPVDGRIPAHCALLLS